jgi:Fe-S oxidoreductase
MRPEQRPMTRLPTLEPRRSALETCVFCPKLSRSACPVSNAEPRETLTPWGKMSMVYFVANASVEASPPFAAPAWACTGCFSCREACDHRNDVAGTLFAARTALVAEGLAPEGAKRAIARFPAVRERYARGLAELRARPGVRASAETAMVVGCTYAHAARAEAEAAVDAAAALAGGVRLVEACCGLPLLHAGDAAGFKRNADALAREVRDARRIVVADAGCAHALRVRYGEHGVTLEAGKDDPKGPRIEHLAEAAARELGRLGRVASPKGPVRWHDPCHLGRGLSAYEAPRAVLTRARGRAPDEFPERRARAACSGAGGALPVTMPDNAQRIAATRVQAHREEGGGRIVTACAASLVLMRRAGAEVDDLATWVARALGL